MLRTCALVLSLLLVPGLAMAQTAPAAPAPADASAPAAPAPVAPADTGTAANANTDLNRNEPAEGTVLTLEGVLNVQVVGKPDITLADGKQFQLIGDKADEINKLENGDGLRIKVIGKVEKSVGDDNLIVDSYELLDKGTAGVSTGVGMGTNAITPAPQTPPANTAPAPANP